MAQQVTYRELVKEIQELDKRVNKKLDRIQESIDQRVLIRDFDEYKRKTDKMWDDRNKVIGYILSGGMIGGATSAALVKIVSEVIANF